MSTISFRTNGSQSNIERVFLFQDDGATNPGKGIPGLAFDDSGLSISIIADVSSSPTVDTSAATSSIETISTLGTYATPTSGFVRFKEIDATNMPGWYEIQWENGVYAVTNAKMLSVSIKGVTDLADFAGQINLDVIDLAGIRTALGMASANMDTQLADTNTVVDGIAANYATDSDTGAITTQLGTYESGVVEIKVDVLSFVGQAYKGDGTLANKLRSTLVS